VSFIYLSLVFVDKPVVDGVDLSIYEGEILCLLGHNGAGNCLKIYVSPQ